MTPQRIQRKRTKGYKSPDNCRYVGRPTIFGNPFDWQEHSREWAVREFRLWLSGTTVNRWPHLTEQRQAILDNLDELRSYQYLSCFCPLGESCHVDVIIDMLSTQEVTK